jgi:opacity protein-like surface antigen
MKKAAGIIIIVVFFNLSSYAQNSYWAFNYQMSIATEKQADFIQDASFRGWGIDGRGFISQKLSVGGSFSWEVFDQIYRFLPPTAVSTGIDNVNGDVTGVQYRYINTLPIMVNTHYYLGSRGAIRPYFGLGIGTAYVEHKTEIGLTAIVADGWGFAAQPEIGVMIPFGLTGAGLNISGRYRYTSQAGDTTFPISFFTIAVGIGFMN